MNLFPQIARPSYPPVEGCTDPTQISYNPWATEDDGSCAGTTCDTATEYQISEMNLVHNGTTCYFTDYAKVSSTSGFSHTFTATISGATVTLSAFVTFVEAK